MSVNWVTPLRPRDPVTRLSRVPRARPLKARETGLEAIIDRVRAEYREMPGLCLTRAQARCLWGLDADVCDAVLSDLLERGFLARTAQDTFVRADGS